MTTTATDLHAYALRRELAAPVTPSKRLFLAVDCPVCKAAVDQPCDYRGTQRRRTTHIVRQDKAVRARRRRESA